MDGLASAAEALGGGKVGLEEPTGPHGGSAGAGRVREGEGNAGVRDLRRGSWAGRA